VTREEEIPVAKLVFLAFVAIVIGKLTMDYGGPLIALAMLGAATLVIGAVVASRLLRSS
jgi:hypothetical protein